MRNHYLFIVIILLFGITLVILGFSQVGSPLSQKGIAFDTKRVTDFMDLRSLVETYYADNNKLPGKLTDMDTSSSTLNDSETQTPYAYHVMSSTQYQLCTTFANSSSDEKKNTTTYLGSYGFQYKKGYN